MKMLELAEKAILVWIPIALSIGLMASLLHSGCLG